MVENGFVYTIYIKSTPKKLWRALTQPSLTKQWWTISMKSDWRVGSTYVLRQGRATIADPEMVVLASEPGLRLSYTWHTFSREWAGENGFDEELRAAFAAERRSVVTFTIQRVQKSVALTVEHGGFDPSSRVLDAVTQGWPPLLSSLKTLLETGEPLAF